MASPEPGQDRYDATYDWAGRIVQNYVTNRFPPETAILDVGAGWGKYRDLLPGYTNMDACEIWQPYIEAEDLRSRYRIVLNQNVTDICMALTTYDLVIFGDVLEHLKRSEATEVLRHCHNAAVIVPFRYHQDEEGGNPYEKHWQHDLTPALMKTLYPDLEEVALDMRGSRPFKGFYVKEEH